MHPCELTDVEIDHIIPKSNFVKGAATYGLPDPPDFGVDDVENLAPICHAHNNSKRDRLYSEIGTLQVATALTDASKRAPGVRQRFRQYLALEGLEASVLSVIMKPEGERYSKEFEDLSRLLVQRLHDIGLDPENRFVHELKVESPDTTVADWPMVPTGGDSRIALITAPLDSDGRFAQRVVNEIFGLDFSELLVTVIEAVKSRLRSQAAAQTDSENVSFSQVPDRFVPTLSQVAFSGGFEQPELQFAGSVDEVDTGTAVQNSENGGELIDVQVLAEYTGTFSATVVLNDLEDLEDVDLDVSSVEITVQIER